ncbi:MAG: hypothetical protein AAGE52_03280 [Myxococcota bacterium]
MPPTTRSRRRDDLSTGRIVLDDPRWDDERIQGLAVVDRAGDLLTTRGNVHPGTVDDSAYLLLAAQGIARWLGAESVTHIGLTSSSERFDVLQRDDGWGLYIRASADLPTLDLLAMRSRR